MSPGEKPGWAQEPEYSALRELLSERIRVSLTLSQVFWKDKNIRFGQGEGGAAQTKTLRLDYFLYSLESLLIAVQDRGWTPYEGAQKTE